MVYIVSLPTERLSDIDGELRIAQRLTKRCQHRGGSGERAAACAVSGSGAHAQRNAPLLGLSWCRAQASARSC
jgi:hypothetical protein